jgi:hypothetical protein
MRLSHSQFDPKTRRILALGNLCLAAGLVLFTFVHPSSQIARNWTHGLSGFLLGFSITVNLFALGLRRRCREKQI